MKIELGEVQKGIYFDCQTNAKLAYNISAAFVVKSLNVETLKNALQLVVSSQEALNYTVMLSDDTIVYDLQEARKLNFVYVDSLGNEELDEMVKKAMCYQFELEKETLYRVTLIQKDAQEQVLVICLHHIIGDGESVSIFVSKLMDYYHSLSKYEPFVLEKNDSYGVFLKKENKRLFKGKYEKQKDYWMNKLKGVNQSAFIEDYSSSKPEIGVGKEQRFPISKNLYENIEKICRENDVTTNMFFLGAFSVLMKKYTREESVVVASPFSNRAGAGTDESIGCYIYTLPLRFDFQENTVFSDIMKQSHQNILEAYRNMGYPSNMIARDASAGNVSASSMFDVTFICDNYEKISDEIIGMYEETDTVTFPGKMMVIMQKYEDNTSIKIQYKEELFSDDSIYLMGQRFIKLLEQIASDTEAKVDDIDLFLEGEKEKIDKELNQTSFFKYNPTSIAKAFEEKVAKYPKEIGILDGDTNYTYEQINQKANQLARKIVSSKKSENSLVGIQLERSIHLVVAVLAVLKSGCGYVPIDYNYPKKRKEYIVKDTEMVAVITDSNLPWDLDLEIKKIFVDDSDTYEGDNTNLDYEVDPHAIAYVEYTSGSTGEPKGVIIENASVVNTVLDLDRRFPLEETDIYLLKTTYTFDIFGTEIYGWIVGKGKLCILEKDGEKNPEAILKAIEKYNITHINFVPSMYRVFLETLENESPQRVRSLKWIFLGGEAVTKDVVEKSYKLGIKAKLENVYGPTEATMWATHCPIRELGDYSSVSIGKPLNEYKCYIVDKENRLQPLGMAGELCISGAGLARGYLNKEDLTKKSFIDNPFYKEGDACWYQMMYRTGDLARWMPDGKLEFLGRIDFQVKVGGVRIELGEVENALCENKSIIQAVAVLKQSKTGVTQICVYYRSKNEIPSLELRNFLSDKIPAYMMPSFFVHMNEIPLNGSGKVNRKALEADQSYLNFSDNKLDKPENETEEMVLAIWKDVLGIEQIGVNDNFFNIGGHSLALMRVHNSLKATLQKDISITTLLRLPTIRKIAEFLNGDSKKENIDRKLLQKKNITSSDIAIIGLATDVPGAENVYEFWDVLKEGRETIRFYTDEELSELGISEHIYKSPNYVNAKGSVGDLEYFDSRFFNIPPREVNMTSPQLRLLYKGVWEVLEDSGYIPDQMEGRTGVFIGGSDDFQWYRYALFDNASYSDAYQAYTLSTNHFLATRLAYKFNFKGPAINILTGCSTSLVTVHLACQSLLRDECDTAIAGGVTVEMPNDGGYMYEKGMMFSPDGHCHPFDASAGGTVFSNGMALVAMKRLEDAMESGDHIYAVIKGSAINNDGVNKISYTAPSEDGQVEVIRQAYSNAGVDPETIGYIEAHGTGTLLGDPIEVSSLTRAFATDKTQYCTLGSIKGNIGHTDTAAGVVGLTKVGLCLDRKFKPATVNYEVPNPKIDFAKTPFMVSNVGQEWTRNPETPDIPLRAGINSFGVGGTNVHVVLEEAPLQKQSDKESDYNLLILSAKSEDALANTMEKVLKFVENNKRVNVSDVAWTLLKARSKFKYKKAIVLTKENKQDLESVIKDNKFGPFIASDDTKKNCYFMFSGQGSQYQGMGKDLYYGNDDNWVCRVYRENIDMLFGYLPEEEREEFFHVLYGDSDKNLINQTKYSQFALFTTQYALAQIMLKMGVQPKALLGHSIGEVVAATIAEVWSVEDAVKIVRARGDLMQMQEPGVMLAVVSKVEDVKKYLNENVWISLCNTTNRCVIGGRKEAIEHLSEVLTENKVQNNIVKTSHAFHTPMMSEAAVKFEEVLHTITMKAPLYPIISNATGTYATDEEITKPSYWAAHIRNRVQFEQDLALMLEDENCLGIEIGAGRTLCSFATQHERKKNGQVFINLMRHIKEDKNDIEYLYSKIGAIYCENTGLDLTVLETGKLRNRISIPTYAFDKLSYPIKINHSAPSDNQKEIFASDGMDQGPIEKAVITNESEAEKQVIEAYKNVFGFEEIDMNMDFFSMGGDSLKAVSLAAVLRNSIGMKLDVQDIFNNTTPKRLSNYIMENYTFADDSAIMPAPKADYYALSSAQKRMYTLYLMDKESLAYNLPSATLIDGRMDKERVEAAVKKLIERHESLRTSFAVVDGEYVQIVNEEVECPVEFVEGSCATDEAFQEMVDDFLKPFDLSQAPLLRMRFVNTPDGKQMLLFDIHHIIADGTAVEILTRDFNALYVGDLEPLKVQYKDFAIWQNEQMESEKMKSQEAFWMNSLSGELPLLEIPTDYERPKISDYQGGRFEFGISDEVCAGLKQLARSFNVTNFMVMLSSWYILLERYSGQEEIIVGTPVSGRTQEDIRETIGMFVNMLALRNYVGEDKKFSDFLLEVKDRTLEALKNQDYQFDTLVEKLNVKRNMNRNAIFDVSFDYHNMDLYELEVDGLKFTARELDSNAVSVDLLLTCNEDSEGKISCYIDYATSLFQEETIRRMTENYVKILEQILADKDVRIGCMDILSDIDNDVIFGQFEKSKLEYDEKQLVHEMFEKVVNKQPEEVALVTDCGEEFTYRYLNEHANALAKHLRANGVGRNSFVGIVPSRNENLIIAMLAILKAGGAYVALDPKYPKDRIDYMMKQCDMEIVISERIHSEMVKSVAKVIFFDELSQEDATENGENLKRLKDASIDDTAYAIFTSGSTGMPKGVMVKHKGFVNIVEDHKNRKIYTQATDRIACIATPSFDIFGFESIIPLCSGGSIYLANDMEQLDSNLLAKKVELHKVTHLQAPVSRLRAMVENTNFKQLLPQLKVIVGGGENYPVALAKYLQSNTSAKLYNMYGPTETTITATVKDMSEESKVTIGEPIANTQVYIINECEKIQPVGVYGELCIAGNGLSKGYIKKPEETQKRFITLKSGEKEISVYRTGDRARLLPDGEIELMGRLDTQVKIRGYRVELGEIERVAMLMESVSYAVAKAIASENGNTQLALFYSTQGDVSERHIENDLKAWIAKKLPNYMVPSYIVYVEEMPFLPNGKVNTKALSVQEMESIVQKKAQTAGRITGMEKKIIEIWKDVLKVDQISIKDNFFDIGGNSYGLMLVNNQLNELLGYTVPLMQLFEYPTIEELAKSFQTEEEFEEQETEENVDSDTDIAVIGMSGRFPGAESVDMLWNNIVNGKESIRSFTEEELLEAGISREEFEDENYVNAKGYLEDVEYFDADFFNYSKKEANMMDPQIRLLHMCVWNALEDAGYNSFDYSGKIGLFAGSSSNLAWMTRFLSRGGDALTAFEAMSMNDKDFLTTKVSYKLNLKGPSVNVQTACSTSLVAIHQGVKYLLANEADMVAAGGVSITYPRKEGYMWHEGMIYSKDGHCRPFSKDSSGTVAGNGCGVVILKKLSRAIKDNDHIYAIIKGSAINNDGINKIGYTAPSVSGEKDVINRALRKANVNVEDICFVETHGTGTELGDPIEIEALKQAWNTNKTEYCAIGSVKANVGHLDAAAGVTGFIKAVNVVNHHTIPPMINYSGINPRIDIEHTPFFVPEKAVSVTEGNMKAAVSAFGIGGTNAHVILGETNVKQRTQNASDTNLIVFSARSKEALKNTSERVIRYLKENHNTNLSDAAYTLLAGRGRFEYRKAYIVQGNYIEEDEKNLMLCVDECYDTSEQEPSTWILPENGFKIDCEIEKSRTGIGMVLQKYLDEGLSQLRFDARMKVKDILAGKEEEQGAESKVAALISTFAVVKTLMALSVQPVSLYGEGIGRLCAYVAAEAITIEEAISILNKMKEDSLSLSDVMKETMKTAQIDVLEELPKDSKVFTINAEDGKMGLLALYKLAGCLWTQGNKIDWNCLFAEEERAKISLPGYVFDKKEYVSDVVLSDIGQNSTESAAKSPRNSKLSLSDDEIRSEFGKIWMELLGVDKVNDNDDYLELGGDSLNAVMMVSVMKERLHISFTVTEILNHTKYHDLVDALLEAKKNSTVSGKEEVIPMVEKRPYYETSSAQKRMYAVSTLYSNNLSYNLGAVYHAEGTLDKKRLEETFTALVKRHEAFRTSFGIEDGEVVQYISEEVPSVVEFKDIEEDDKELEIKNSIRPFDLSQSPLFRVKILSTREDNHYIIMDMHHIIGDQSSLGIIMNEFYMLYKGKELEETKLRYIDFAQWQNKLIENGQMDKQLDYWKKEYEDEIPSLEFPTDFVRKPENLHEGKMIHFELSKELSKNMNQWLKEQHVTPYMLMMASLSLVLWKYSAKKDIVVGTAVAGRKTEELSGIVGMFVNTLPIRINIDQSKNKSQHLQYIKQKMLEAFEAQDCQFDMLLEELHVEKDPSRNPLFDVIINYVNMGTEEFTIDGLKMSPVVSDTIATKYDLTFTVAECDGEYSIDIEYSTGLFKEETIRLLGERFISVIDNFILAPDESLTDLSIVSDEDRRHMDKLKEQNEKNAVVTDTVVSAFERCVSQFGDKEALVWKDKSYTYKELNNMVNKTASLLRESGVQAKDKVAILLERGPEQIISIFAILKCGAAYLPIDCEYPEQRVNYMQEDSNSRKVIVQKDYAQVITAKEKIFLFPNEVLEMQFEENSAIACEATPVDLSNEDEAYVIYTSGSTGQPKGVIVTHKGVVSTLLDSNYFKADSSDRILQFSNYTFDASAFNIFGALLNGSALVLAPKEALLEMPKLAQIIREQNITQGLIVTAIFNMLVDYDVTAIKGMSKVFIGGEALSLNHMKKAFAAVGPNHLVNIYGPTETTIIATYHLIDEIKEEWTDIPIGKAITSTSLYVADELGNELPYGVAGELLIGGDRVAKGYLNRDELTKERFVNLKSNPDARVYHTGDKVKMHADGILQFLGRIDFQIKLRGFRIELGEVERHVASIEGVKEAVAVAKKDRSGSVYIAAYYTVASKEYDYVTPDYIHKVLKKQIPDYLIPSRMLCLESLPITHNGKVDRRALPEIELKAVPVNMKAEGLGNAEGTILNLMREVVDNGCMDVNDNFFECGGQSIKAILFTQRLRDMGIDVMVNDLFQYPTAEEFAKLEAVRSVLSENEADSSLEDFEEEGTTHLDEMQIRSIGSQICQITSLLSDTISKNEVVNEFSMTPVQKKHNKAKENKGGFTMIAEGTENEIKKKITSLIVKHQLLHCTCQEDREVWKEHSVKDKIFEIMQSVIVFDISDFDKETKEKVVQNVFHGLADAEHGEEKLLWRIACLKVSNKKIQIVWCFNHCIFDGMSAEILKKQILSKEKMNLLDVDTVKYEDYVNLLRISEENGNEQEILESMRLKQWAKFNGSLVQKIQQDNGELKTLQLRIPRNQMNENIWTEALLTATHFLQEYYQQKEIPVAILNYGRTLGDVDFYEYVGEFLELIPILTGDSENTMEEQVEALVRYSAENAVSLLNLSNSQSDKYQEMKQLLGGYTDIEKGLDLILFNFQGYITKAEQSLFEHLETTEENNNHLEESIASVLITSNYDDDFLNVRIDNPNGFNQKNVQEILHKDTLIN